MPNKIQKSLQDYISKMKKTHQPVQLASNSISSSKNWILSGCIHPKTHCFPVSQRRKPETDLAGGDHNDDDAATLSDIDRFLFENFKSLYIEEQESSNANCRNREPDRTDPVLFESNRFVNPPPDFCGSNRFFFSPGKSSSLMEEARSHTTATSDERSGDSKSSSVLSNSDGDDGKEIRLPDRCIALLAKSASPAEDFRRSMQELMDAKNREEEGKIDWEYMEEMLFCYLEMNEKKSYKYILSAFVDQIVVMRKKTDAGAPERPRNFAWSRRRNRGTVRWDDENEE